MVGHYWGSYLHYEVQVHGPGDRERLEADVRRHIEEVNGEGVVHVRHKVGGVCLVCPTPLSDQSNYRYWYTLLKFIGWCIH